MNIKENKAMEEIAIKAENLNVYYGNKQVLFNINLSFPKNQVTSLIGPSGCGKTTFIKCINRMNDVIPSCLVEGRVMMNDSNILDKTIDVVSLRAKVGLVFQKPNPFPKSVFENVAYGPRIHQMAKNKRELAEIVEESLVRAGLFDEVKDRLDVPGISLSGGQQQRLCIARTIAIKPEVILMDEPCSSLDPIATSVIEDLLAELSNKLTIIIVTHSMQQAARVSKTTAFFHLGRMIEVGSTESMFTRPKEEKTQAYITGRFG